MGFISAQLDDVTEGQIVPDGEYTLRIVKVDDKNSKKGNPITVLTIRIEDPPPEVRNASLITHVINHITHDTPADQRNMRLLETKRLLSVFGVGYVDNGYDTDDLQGAEGMCFVTQEEGDDRVVRNKLRLPRLKE